MTLLEQLQNILKPGHTLAIEPLSKDSYFRVCNKRDNDSKYLFTIKLSCPDSTAGKGFVEHEFFTLADLAPSKLSSFYNKQINSILDKATNGQLYCSGYCECGTEIAYDIRWLSKKLIKA